MGSYTREEFKRLAEQYAEPFNDAIDQDYLYMAANTAFETLGQELTSSDFSILLNVDAGEVENKMATIGYNKSIDIQED